MRQTNTDHHTAKRTRPEPRGLLRIVVVALAISLSVLEFGASLSMGAGPSSQSQDMQLQVTQCSNGDPSSCDQSTETVTQQPKKPAEHTVTVTPVQQQPAPAQEVHVYSLK